MPTRASGRKFWAAATATGSNPPKNVASATLNPSRYGVVGVPRHGLLIEKLIALRPMVTRMLLGRRKSC
jgi:hypothetical protein